MVAGKAGKAKGVRSARDARNANSFSGIISSLGLTSRRLASGGGGVLGGTGGTPRVITVTIPTTVTIPAMTTRQRTIRSTDLSTDLKTDPSTGPTWLSQCNPNWPSNRIIKGQSMV